MEKQFRKGLCAAFGCQAQTSHTEAMCVEHWNMVPEALRKAVLVAWNADGSAKELEEACNHVAAVEWLYRIAQRRWEQREVARSRDGRYRVTLTVPVGEETKLIQGFGDLYYKALRDAFHVARKAEDYAHIKAQKTKARRGYHKASGRVPVVEIKRKRIHLGGAEIVPFGDTAAG